MAGHPIQQTSPFHPSNQQMFSRPIPQMQDPGFNMCLLDGPVKACVTTPSSVAPILGVGIIITIFFIGYLFGRIIGARKTMNRLAKIQEAPEMMIKWSQKETSSILSYTLIISGLVLFLVGASGTIELEIPGAKLVTSLPGLVVIFLGYNTWKNIIETSS